MTEHKQSTDRLRTWKDRQRRGVIVAPIEIEPATLTAALRSRGIIQANEQPDRTELANHASAIVELFCSEPLTKA